ncbi:MAG: phosphoribosylglycinamide formyltransferase [Lactobacillales bacterium]|jgi:phosphoribosylglycinamide formyltransferase-1|nr:phosphoribosylglycinamide formyltransferase [Lactobacillales bacterium]
MKKIAVFASGNGSNFQVIAEKVESGEIPAEICFLFCDKGNAFALERAEKLKIKTFAFSPKNFESRKQYEEAILELCRSYGVELIVLAGYMRIVGETLLTAYPNKIINIHPSLLPNFPGLHGIADAFEAGVEETGVTVHYIDNGVDTGPIIAQEKIKVEKEETLESLEEKIHAVEHVLYPRVLKEIISKRDKV